MTRKEIQLRTAKISLDLGIISVDQYLSLWEKLK